MEQDGKLFMGFAAGYVTSGEISEAMFWPIDTELTRQFLQEAKQGKIPPQRIKELKEFLSEKALTFQAFVSDLEGMAN